MINLTKKVISQALDCVPQATIIVNSRKHELPIAYVNPAAEVLLGRDASELIGASMREIVAQGELPEPGADTFAMAPRDASLEADDGYHEQRWNAKEGPTMQVRFRASPLYDRPGKPGYWMLQIPELAGQGQGRDTEASLKDALTDARRKLKTLERTDSATGIPNHAAFVEIMQRDWSIARREQRCLGLIIFEVDAFAEYRDLFGRHAADSVLRNIARSISGSLRRGGDFAARYDQSRFAVLIGSASEIQAENLAESIANKVRNLSIHHPRSPVGRFLTLSYGVASKTPDWNATSSSLVARAEEMQAANRPPADGRTEEPGEAASA